MFNNLNNNGNYDILYRKKTFSMHSPNLPSIKTLRYRIVKVAL